jgi:cellulose synthase/poly-beta-1,6-N-acetylglucosamine synthase-like glycosyltransferase
VAPLTIFLVSIAFCAYTMIGYPLLLAVLARMRNRKVHKAPKQASVSVILPVHNGERWIGAKLKSILALDYPRQLMEIIVVSDGSDDATNEIVRCFMESGKIRLLELDRGGKAAALNAGIAHATGEILFFTDVRQELSKNSLANLVACFADPEIGVASGELIIRESPDAEETSVGAYWKYEKWIRKQLTRIDSVLGATGCIYAMRRELAEPLPEHTLVDDMYLPLAAFFRGYRVVLDDTAVAFDYPTKLASEFRRKVRTLAGVYQVMGYYPALLGPQNRMWLHFVSHKLARLLMPWALIAALLATFRLQPPLYFWAMGAQFLVYALAAADPVTSDSWKFKRFTSRARTFVVLMAAALCAVSILFVPARLLWRETNVSAATVNK